MIFVEISPKHRLGREVTEILRLEGANFDNRDERAVGDRAMQRRQGQADITAGDGVEPRTLEGEREEFRDGRLTVGAGDGDGGTGPEPKSSSVKQCRPARRAASIHGCDCAKPGL
jgi:hypothetical protein